MTHAYSPLAADAGSRLSGYRGWVVAAFFTLVWICAVVAFAPIGFNPTDDGLIVAQAGRLLDGAAPHAGVVSPRPLGSPLLHIVDVVLPTPLLVTSRAIALLEGLALAIAGLRLLTNRPVRSWRVVECSLVLVVLLVGLHTFPLMAWHTVDGLLLAVVALLVLDRGLRRASPATIAVGAALAGFTPLIKQSYAPVPLLAIAWVLWRRHELGGRDHLPGRQTVLAMTALAAPGLLYLAWVATVGSMRVTVDQLLADTVDPFGGIRPGGMALVAAVISVGATLVAARQGRIGAQVGTRLINWLALTLVSAALVTVLAGGLELRPTWGITLWWIAAGSVGLRSVVDERIDPPGVAILALAWMASLSYGYPSPNLAAGLLLSLILLRAGPLALVVLPRGRSHSERLITITAVTLALVVAMASAHVRHNTVYRDTASGDQTVALGTFGAFGSGVHTNPRTGAYLQAVSDCLDAHPASNLAVLPDNAIAAVLFDRTNPFPVAWWYPQELPSDRTPILDATRRVSSDGDYLVLFQTQPAEDLASTPALPPASPASELFDYPDGIVQDVFDALDGAVVTCGPFVARYQPTS